ncbi:hypothetical protein ACQ86K_32820 [Mucilaginibacter sp. P19]
MKTSRTMLGGAAAGHSKFLQKWWVYVCESGQNNYSRGSVRFAG